MCFEKKLLKFEICLKIRILLEKLLKQFRKNLMKFYKSLLKFITVKVYCILNKVYDCWEKFAKVWTNVGNLIENLKSFSETFNKNLEKFNENLKCFFIIDSHTLSSKNLCSRGTIPPLEPLLTVLCNHTRYIAESQEVELRGLASDITIRQGYRNISCLLILLLNS